MSGNLQLCLCTCPDMGIAERIAETLVTEQLAACVNIIPGITSVYRWKGAVEHDQEIMLLIKTSESVQMQLEECIQAIHPYELPEIITVPIHTGQVDYIKWIKDSLKTS